MDTNIFSEAVRPRPAQAALDMILAATAAAYGLVVVSANDRHVRDCGVPWLNPMAAGT